MATIPLSFGTGGAGSDDATATLAQVLSPYTAITSDSNDEAEPGTMVDKSGTTSTAAVSESGSNIKMAVPANGYYDTAASLQAAASTFGNASAADVLSGKTFTSSAGLTKSGTISSKAAATYNTSSSDQEIASGQYLSGKQTIKAVTTSNISAANIKYGVNVKVGDANNSGRIANVTGSCHEVVYFFKNLTSTASNNKKNWTTGVGTRSFSYLTIDSSVVGAGFNVLMVSAFVDSNNHNSACSDRYYGVMVRNSSDGTGYFCEGSIQGTGTKYIPVSSSNQAYHVNICGYY